MLRSGLIERSVSDAGIHKDIAKHCHIDRIFVLLRKLVLKVRFYMNSEENAIHKVITNVCQEHCELIVWLPNFTYNPCLYILLILL